MASAYSRFFDSVGAGISTANVASATERWKDVIKEEENSIENCQSIEKSLGADGRRPIARASPQSTRASLVRELFARGLTWCGQAPLLRLAACSPAVENLSLSKTYRSLHATFDTMGASSRGVGRSCARK